MDGPCSWQAQQDFVFAPEAAANAKTRSLVAGALALAPSIPPGGVPPVIVEATDRISVQSGVTIIETRGGADRRLCYMWPAHFLTSENHLQSK